MRKGSKVIDILILIAGILLAVVVIGLSFSNTAKFAELFGVNPYLAAGVVEFIFALLLAIRGYQRATQRNVPLFIEGGYFFFFAIVTAVNMYGLGNIEPILGHIAGLVISGAMWLMESTLVWWLTKKNQPYTKSVRERMRDAKRDIQEEKAIQRIEWMKWEAKKPDLRLIREARKVEEKRKDTVGDGLPEFFQIEPVQQIIAVATEKQEEVQVIPIQRQIGFLNEEKKPSPLFRPNEEAREKAIQTAQQLTDELGRIPTTKEIREKGISEHYSRLARKEIENG